MVTENDNTGIQIELVRVEDIDQRWPLVADLVAGSLRKAPSDFSAGDAWTRCRSGDWFLLLAWNEEHRIGGFTIWHFTANGFFVCALLGGRNMGEWLPQTLKVATSIAKAHGCNIAGACRPGLMKLLQSKYLPQAAAVRIQFVAPV